MAHIALPPDLPGIRGAFAFRPETARPMNALVEILLEAGLPPLAISCLTGSGSALGDAIEIGPTGNNVRDLRILLAY